VCIIADHFEFVDDLQLTCFQHVCFTFSAMFRLTVIEPLPAVCKSLFLCSNSHVLILGLLVIFSLYVIVFDIVLLSNEWCFFFILGCMFFLQLILCLNCNVVPFCMLSDGIFVLLSHAYINPHPFHFHGRITPNLDFLQSNHMLYLCLKSLCFFVAVPFYADYMVVSSD
jgi:hypothetical protein